MGIGPSRRSPPPVVPGDGYLSVVEAHGAGASFRNPTFMQYLPPPYPAALVPDTKDGGKASAASAASSCAALGLCADGVTAVRARGTLVVSCELVMVAISLLHGTACVGPRATHGLHHLHTPCADTTAVASSPLSQYDGGCSLQGLCVLPPPPPPIGHATDTGAGAVRILAMESNWGLPYVVPTHPSAGVEVLALDDPEAQPLPSAAAAPVVPASGDSGGDASKSAAAAVASATLLPVVVADYPYGVVLSTGPIGPPPAAAADAPPLGVVERRRAYYCDASNKRVRELDLRTRRIRTVLQAVHSATPLPATAAMAGGGGGAEGAADVVAALLGAPMDVVWAHPDPLAQCNIRDAVLYVTALPTGDAAHGGSVADPAASGPVPDPDPDPRGGGGGTLYRLELALTVDDVLDRWMVPGGVADVPWLVPALWRVVAQYCTQRAALHPLRLHSRVSFLTVPLLADRVAYVARSARYLLVPCSPLRALFAVDARSGAAHWVCGTELAWPRASSKRQPMFVCGTATRGGGGVGGGGRAVLPRDARHVVVVDEPEHAHQCAYVSGGGGCAAVLRLMLPA